MPLVYVQRFGQQVVAGGTQYITGQLQFTGPTVIELDPAVFNQAGLYVLFDYSALGASFPGGQAALDTYVTIDATSLIPPRAYVANSLLNDTANSRITVTLS